MVDRKLRKIFTNNINILYSFQPPDASLLAFLPHYGLLSHCLLVLHFTFCSNSHRLMSHLSAYILGLCCIYLIHISRKYGHVTSVPLQMHPAIVFFCFLVPMTPEPNYTANKP